MWFGIRLSPPQVFPVTAVCRRHRCRCSTVYIYTMKKKTHECISLFCANEIARQMANMFVFVSLWLWLCILCVCVCIERFPYVKYHFAFLPCGLTFVRATTIWTESNEMVTVFVGSFVSIPFQRTEEKNWIAHTHTHTHNPTYPSTQTHTHTVMHSHANVSIEFTNIVRCTKSMANTLYISRNMAAVPMDEKKGFA